MEEGSRARDRKRDTSPTAGATNGARFAPLQHLSTCLPSRHQVRGSVGSGRHDRICHLRLFLVGMGPRGLPQLLALLPPQRGYAELLRGHRLVAFLNLIWRERMSNRWAFRCIVIQWAGIAYRPIESDGRTGQVHLGLCVEWLRRRHTSSNQGAGRCPCDADQAPRRAAPA